MTKKTFFFLLFSTFQFFGLGVSSIVAQSEEPVKSTFDHENWEKIVKNLDYSQDEKQKKKQKEYLEKEKNQNPILSDQPFFSNGAAQTFKFLFFTLAIIALAFVLWRIAKNARILKNPKIKKENPTLEEALQDTIEESDLERFLRQALHEKDYKLAIRIYYLLIIKELALKKQIIWKKDKTNSDYVKEVNAFPYSQDFRLLTHQFEKIWYGDRDLQLLDYQQLSPQFQQFVEQLKQTR